LNQQPQKDDGQPDELTPDEKDRLVLQEALDSIRGGKNIKYKHAWIIVFAIKNGIWNTVKKVIMFRGCEITDVDASRSHAVLLRAGLTSSSN